MRFISKYFSECVVRIIFCPCIRFNNSNDRLLLLNLDDCILKPFIQYCCLCLEYSFDFLPVVNIKIRQFIIA